MESSKITVALSCIVAGGAMLMGIAGYTDGDDLTWWVWLLVAGSALGHMLAKPHRQWVYQAILVVSSILVGVAITLIIATWRNDPYGGIDPWHDLLFWKWLALAVMAGALIYRLQDPSKPRRVNKI